MQFTGKIIKIGPEMTVGQNNLAKITFIVEETGDMEDYKKNSMAIDVLGDKVDLIKQFKEGDLVRVGLNFKASEFNDKMYNRISARRIDASDGSMPTSDKGNNSGDEDLPF